MFYKYKKLSYKFDNLLMKMSCLENIVVLCVGGSWRHFSSVSWEAEISPRSPDFTVRLRRLSSAGSPAAPHTSRMPPPPPKKNNAKKGEMGWFLLIFIVSSFIQVESCFVGILNVAKVAEHHCAKHILKVAVWRKVNSVSYSVSINMFNTFGCVLNHNIIHFQFESV